MPGTLCFRWRDGKGADYGTGTGWPFWIWLIRKAPAMSPFFVKADAAVILAVPILGAVQELLHTSGVLVAAFEEHFGNEEDAVVGGGAVVVEVAVGIGLQGGEVGLPFTLESQSRQVEILEEVGVLVDGILNGDRGW